MKIPGVLLTTPVTVTAVEQGGDGPTDAGLWHGRGDVKMVLTRTQDGTGGTLVSGARVRIRPSVRVAGRPPQPGDRLTLNGRGRTIASVEPVQGPGRSVAYLELIAGDG